jgi:hypothetical protein
VVAATNPGGAILTGPLNLRGNSYLTFLGFKIVGDTHAVSCKSNGVGKQTHHCTFQQVGFTATDVTLNNAATFTLSDGTNNCLVEDCWGWGGGRYVVMAYGWSGGGDPNLTADYNTFRRLVLRMGPSTGTAGNPQAGLALYGASYCTLDNVICIDGMPASDSSNAGFYITGHAAPPDGESFNTHYGCLVLNHLGHGYYNDSPGSVADNNEVYDSVFWDCAGSGIVMGGGTGASDSLDNTVIDHCTSGAHGGRGFRQYAAYLTTLTNNAFYANATNGASRSTTGTVTTVNNNGYYGNGAAARENIDVGAGDLTSDPGFSYITRIEAASPYKAAGSTGDIGANMVKRYVDGVLTADDLWPWPFEARIKAEMAADDTRGFCAAGETLTHYVWNYLGNGSPY